MYCITSISEAARESCPGEDSRWFEVGVLTKHSRRLPLLTKLKLPKKEEGRRNVTMLGDKHWHLILLLQVDVPGRTVGSCPRTSIIGVSILETAVCGWWGYCLKTKSGHYHPFSFSLFLSRMTVTFRGIFNNISLAHALKVSLFFSLFPEQLAFCLEPPSLPRGHDSRLWASGVKNLSLDCRKNGKKKKKSISVNFGMFF